MSAKVRRFVTSTPAGLGSRVIRRFVSQAVTGPAGADGAGVSVATKESGAEKVAVTTVLDFLTGFDVAGAAGVASVSLDLTEYAGGALPLANGGTGATDAAGVRSALGLVIGTNVQAYDADLSTIAAANNSAVLAATTEAFTTADGTKLDGIEAAADVTDATNVAAAGAVMKTLADAKGDLFVASAADTVTRLAVGTNTHVLTADSAEATGVKWAAAAGGGSSFGAVPGSLLVSGKYSRIWPLLHSAVALTTTTRMMYIPWIVPRSITIDRIGIHVTTGVATTNCRIGIYNSANDLPTSLIADLGSVDTSSTGVKELTVSQVIPAGLVFLAVAKQGTVGAVSLYGLGYTVWAGMPEASTSTLMQYGSQYMYEDSVTGALPSTATPLLTSSANGLPGLFVRLA